MAAPVPPGGWARTPWAGGPVRLERSRPPRAAPGRVAMPGQVPPRWPVPMAVLPVAATARVAPGQVPRWPVPMALPVATGEPADDPRLPGPGAQGRAPRTRPGTGVERAAQWSLRSMRSLETRPGAFAGSPRASSQAAATVAASPASMAASALPRAVTRSAPAEPAAVMRQPGAREVRRVLPAMPRCRRAQSATRPPAHGRAAKAAADPSHSRMGAPPLPGRAA